MVLDGPRAFHDPLQSSGACARLGLGNLQSNAYQSFRNLCCKHHSQEFRLGYRQFCSELSQALQARSFSSSPAIRLAILSLLAASIVLSYLATINPPPDPLFRLYRFCHARAAWSRSGIVLLLVGGFLVLDMALAHNPRDFGYASLLPAVLISGVFFGFGCGL